LWDTVHYAPWIHIELASPVRSKELPSSLGLSLDRCREADFCGVSRAVFDLDGQAQAVRSRPAATIAGPPHFRDVRNCQEIGGS
jgi:hypothetical protein